MPSITPFDLIKIQKLAGDSQKAIDDFMDLQDIMMDFDMNELEKLKDDAFKNAFNKTISDSDKVTLAYKIKTLTDVLDKIIEKLDSEGIKKAERLCKVGITNVLTQPIFVRVITPFFESKMPNLFEKLKLLLSFVLDHEILQWKQLDKYKRFEGGGENSQPDKAQIFKLRTGLKQINNAFKELGKALVKKRPLLSFPSNKTDLQTLVNTQKDKFKEIIKESQVEQIIAKLDELFKKASESSGDQDEEMLTLEICRIDGSNLPQCVALVKNLELRYKELDYKNKIPNLEKDLKAKKARKEVEDKNKDKLTKEDLTYKGQDYLTQLNILADIKDAAERKVEKRVQNSDGHGGKRRKKRKTNKRKSRKRKKKTIRKKRNKTKKSNKKRTRKRRKRHK